MDYSRADRTGKLRFGDLRQYMFGSIGRKIKLVTEISCWLGIVLCLIAGVLLLAGWMLEEAPATPWPGLLTLTLGPLGSWLSSLLLYGFGEMIETNQRNCYLTEGLLQRNKPE